ncbi:MAG: sulfite exporter TauE/SafE family protein [Alphaproteobacteria bacterium]
MLPIETIAFLVTGAALAGLVMGLVGFGTGLAALGFWLFVVDPALAVPLISICSLATAAFTFRVFSHAISWKRLAPFFIGGAAGLPLGVALLAKLDPGIFKIATGLFLILYTAFRLMILPQIKLRNAGRAGDAIVGFGGGILGGFAAIPGPFSTVWCGLRGWSKDEQRAVYQPYNQIILLFAFAGYATQGLVTKELGVLALYCVPASFAGLGLGMAGYKRLDEAQFQRAVLLLLFASGVMLVALNTFQAFG